MRSFVLPRRFVAMNSFYHGQTMKDTDIGNAIAVLVFRLTRSRIPRVKSKLDPLTRMDSY